MAPLSYVYPAAAVFPFREEGAFLANTLSAGLNPVLESQEILELRSQDFSALSAALLLCCPSACSAGAEHSHAL